VVVGRMVRGEYAWVVCVCISYTGDGGQLGGRRNNYAPLC